MRLLIGFVQESNRIEGILRAATAEEILVSEGFLLLERMSVNGLSVFQQIVAPARPLRTARGMNVRVGTYIAPYGGPRIKADLELICHDANEKADPWHVHVAFETLHPYMDGNGRTGRILWLWMMKQRSDQEYRRALELGFLHSWYYQTLAASNT